MKKQFLIFVFASLVCLGGLSAQNRTGNKSAKQTDNSTQALGEDLLEMAGSSAENDLMNAREFYSLEDAMKSPSEVVKLNLSRQQLESVPDGLSNFPNLQVLNLSYNNIKDAGSLGNLKQLRELYLEYNQLTTVPDGITRLPELRSLYLSGNQIKSIPGSIGGLKNLEKLFVPHNDLTALPSEIGQLQQLKYFYVNGNDILSYPEAMMNLRSLIVLSVSGNPANPKLKELAGLPRLKYLYVDGVLITYSGLAAGYTSQQQNLNTPHKQSRARSGFDLTGATRANLDDSQRRRQRIVRCAGCFVAGPIGFILITAAQRIKNTRTARTMN